MRFCSDSWFEGLRLVRMILVVAWLCAPPGEAQSPDCPAKLKASDAAAGDLLGCAVSLSDDLLVMGSLLDDDRGSDSGSAYVLRRTGSGWSQIDKLLGSTTSGGDQFGFSVAASGSYVIVGAPFNSTGGTAGGAAYVFRCTGVSCGEQARLTALDAAPFDQFGFSVSIDDSTAVIGAPGADAVEIYQRGDSSWTRQGRVQPLDAEIGDGFGFAVSIRGDTLVVGSPFADSSGAAYIFQRAGTWAEQRKLVAGDGAAGDRFGHSVAISSGTAVVGAPANGGGAAYLFTGSGSNWNVGQRLAASGVSGGDRFGVSVAINAGADRVLVGAQLADDSGPDAGTAYVFKRGGSWNQEAQLNDPRLQPGDESGLGAAIDGNVAVVGAFKDDVNGADSGAAYVFCLDDEPVDADLELIQSGPASAGLEDVVTYQLTVTNRGPATATGVVLDYPTPTGVTFAGAGAPCAAGFPCGLPDLAPEESATVEVAFLTPATCPASPIVNLAIVSAAGPDPDPGNDSSTVTTTIVGCVDLSVSIDADLGNLCSEKVLTYVVTVANDGDAAAEGAVLVSFADPFAVTWTCTSSQGAECTATGAGDVIDLVSLPVGSSVVYVALAAADFDTEGFIIGTSAMVTVPPGFVESTPGNNVAEHTVDVDCQPTPLGPDFQVNSYTTYVQQYPSIATDADGNFVVAWGSFMTPALPGQVDIRAQRFTSAGIGLSSEFRVNSTTGFSFVPAVDFDSDGNFVIVWSQCTSIAFPCPDSNIQGQRFLADGSPTGSEFQVNSFTTGSQRGRLGLDFDAAGNFVVVWHSSGSSGSDHDSFSIQGQRFAPDASRLGGEFQVNSYITGRQYMPAVAVHPDGSFVVVWQSDGSGGTDLDVSIQGQQYSPGGRPLLSEFQVNTHTTYRQDNPRVTAGADGNFMVVWNHCESVVDSYGRCPANIRGQRFAADESMQEGEFQVNSYTTGNQDIAFVTSDPDGGFVVVWHSMGSSESDTAGLSIQGQRYGADGSRIGDEFQVNSYTTGYQGYPSVAADSEGNFVVVWQSEGSGETDTSATSIQGRRLSPPYADATGGSATALYLNDSRFKVEVEWRDFESNTGLAQAVPYGSDDSGLFWFFDPDNWEMLVKVLNGCAYNESFWVFAAPSTNVEFTLRVTDTFAGEVKSYFNALGTAAAIVDTGALPTCSVAPYAPPPAPAILRQPAPYLESPTPQAPVKQGGCSPSSTRLCLNQGRFQVEIEWQDFAANQGSGYVVAGRTSDSGLFWFFDPDNWEMLVKVLDGCGYNQHFWVLAAATTTVEYRLRVTDTDTGEEREYLNPLGTVARPILDIDAFATCP